MAIVQLAQLPKAELHLHLEGAPRWFSIREALQRHQKITLPETPYLYSPEFRFADFSEFRHCFRRYIYPWLRSPGGYAELIDDVVASILEQQIRYVELNFSVATVERVGCNLDTVLDLLAAAVERSRQQGTTIRIFAGIDRQEPTEQVAYRVGQLLDYPIIAGFDLHGAEVGAPADRFREPFARAREAGKKIKAHAGEMDGPESILAAIKGLGVNQIGHGTSAIQDPEVLKELVRRNVVVEMCPTSNERLRNVASYQDHPILELDAAGVAVTVNSDDPSFFGTNLTGEMARLISERGVSMADLVRWTRNAFACAILDQETKAAIDAELDA